MTCKIKGLELGEIQISLLNGIAITAHAALTDGEEVRFGMVTKRLGWSEETIKLMARFMESAEKDMHADFFETDPSSSVDTEPTQI